MPIQFGQLFVPAGAINPAWTCFSRLKFDSTFSGIATMKATISTTNPALTELEIEPVDPSKITPPQLMGYYGAGVPGTWLLRVDGEISAGQTRTVSVSKDTGTTPGTTEQKITFL